MMLSLLLSSIIQWKGYCTNADECIPRRILMALTNSCNIIFGVGFRVMVFNDTFNNI